MIKWIKKLFKKKLYKNTKVDKKALEAARRISAQQRNVLDKLSDTYRSM